MTLRASIPSVEHTHACVRCGAQIPLEDAMCERCNPLGLRQPSNSQAHGTVVVGIGIAVLVLAVLGRIALSGIGPFDGTVAGVASDPPNLTVTLTVTNHGSRDGSVTCRVYNPTNAGITPSDAYVLSPTIPAGGTISFSKLVTEFGSTPRTLEADCSG